MSQANAPVQVIVAAFQSEDGAKQALKELKQARNQGLINIEDAAVIRKDEKGKLHLKETADMSTGKGASIGAVIGGVVGLLAGPVGVAVGAGAGAAIGGLAAHGDAGIKDERLEKIGEGLEPGTSAIVAIVEHRWVAVVRQQLEEEAADVMAQQLSADIHEQLVQGKEVSYSAIAAEGAASVTRTAAGEDEMDQQSILVTEEGVATEEIVANKEGMAARQMVSTAAGTEVTEAVVTEDGAIVVDAITDGEEAVITGAVLLPEEEGAEAALEEGAEAALEETALAAASAEEIEGEEVPPEDEE